MFRRLLSFDCFAIQVQEISSPLSRFLPSLIYDFRPASDSESEETTFNNKSTNNKLPFPTAAAFLCTCNVIYGDF